MARTVRVGIIGAGNIAASAHVPGYRATPDVEIAAVCDVVPCKAAAFAAEHGIPAAYESHAEIIAR